MHSAYTAEAWNIRRRACKVLGQSRSVQRYKPNRPWEQEVLRKDIVRLTSRYGRYGYRRITAVLRAEGWNMDFMVIEHKRFLLFWERESAILTFSRKIG